jgi:spermidine synthase
MKEEIYDILDEMKLKIPEEIKRCAKVVANKDQIIASAEERAEKITKSCKIYNKDYHYARFALPNYLKELL